MNSTFFHYSSPTISPTSVESFNGSRAERKLLSEIVNEWNSRTSLSLLCKKWKKVRPHYVKQNLLLLLFNVEGLNTHVADVDLLLSNYHPHICIFTGVGSAVYKHNQFTFPNYNIISQPGTNAFGGVMILHLQSLKCKIIEKASNLIWIELSLHPSPIYIGAIYVPPTTLPPFQLLSKYQNNPFYLFGDFNAKHTNWGCQKNNSCGVHLSNWLETTGKEVIIPNKPTSKRSESIIDFGITHDAKGWSTEVLDEGTSDHYPVLFQSQLAVGEDSIFRNTNWKIFNFFLSLTSDYWMSVVYNIDEQAFFSLFSTFLSSLWDKCSTYISAKNYRPPWPPDLVLLAKSVNRARRAYRRNKSKEKLQYFLSLKDIFMDKRTEILNARREQKITELSSSNNIWKFAKPSFHAFSPPFKGISSGTSKITDQTMVVDILANYFEMHFNEPKYDEFNENHLQAIQTYQQFEYLPNIPLERITMIEVINEWKKFKPKKSSDSSGTSAFMLKHLPESYIGIMTILFNKCAERGEFFSDGKHAKVICLSKDGLYPTVNKVRPISLLPNIGKWYERIIHARILKWCEDSNIFVDEQSGFTAQRRLQTRIISLVEDIRQTITACNRPALVIFVDFMTAFDRMWFPALISTLHDLEMPIPYIKWIASWLKNRTLSVHYGDAISRTINVNVGAPQGSVLAATLFRLHIHFLPKIFFNLTTHLFADDLAILITGALEKRFSVNISYLEERAKKAMILLEYYAENKLLPVNVDKTKAILIHSIVSPKIPKLTYKNQGIEIVPSFKYLGVTITTKLGWGKYINLKLKKVRIIYNAMKILFYKIPKKDIATRRRIFFAFALPHFLWLISTWFFYTERQQNQINSTYMTGIRIVYGLIGWDNTTTQIISQEKTLYDCIYSYWCKFSLHLERSIEAFQYQNTWTAHLIITSYESSSYKILGFRKDNKFINRLAKRARHSKDDWLRFAANHRPQHEVFKKSTFYLNLFVYKYFLLPP